MIRRGRESNAVHVEPLFTFITLYHISVRFWHQAIAEHFDFQVGKVVMSETALLKSRKWKKLSFGETFEQMTSHSY